MFDGSNITTADTLKNIKKSLTLSLANKYGISDEEVIKQILDIHGVSKEKFDFVNSVEILIKDRLNDVSIDANSNKNEKTIESIYQESVAPIKKAIGFDYLYRQMKELFGKAEAKRLSGEMFDLSLGLSDSTNILKPYSYYAHTPIIVRINGNIKYITMKKLFDNYKEFANYSEEHEMDEVKDCNNLEVWDSNCESWVKISRIIRHKNKEKMVVYETNGGDIAFVTSDHPVYMADGTEKIAKDLKLGDKVLVKNSLPNTGVGIDEDNDYAYSVGFNLNLNNLSESLPENIMLWPKEAIEFFIAGLIDNNDEEMCDLQTSISSMSYSLINQVSDVLKLLDIESSKSFCGRCFRINFRLNRNIGKLYDISCDNLQNKVRGNVVSTICIAPHISKHIIKECEYVYDITTETGSFYANGMVQHNCWALDASKIVVAGRQFGQLHSKPSKRVSSYISALCETVHQLSSHLAGAIAIGTFFLDLAHLSLYKEGINLDEIKNNKETRKKIENEMQQLVHSVNHLSRNGIESPFTNLSLFDRTKLKTLLGEMKWYFPQEELADNINLSEEEHLKYVIDYIIEMQDIFLDFFDMGDPLKGGSPYRFPVVTLNLGKKTVGGKEVVEDAAFLEDICKRDIFRYNIFVSEGTKISACCRLLVDSEMLELASLSNSFGAGGAISLGSHRVCTINFMRIAIECKDMDDLFNILNSRVDDCAKILKSHKELLKMLVEKGLQPFISMGWINMSRLFSTFGILGIYEAVKTLEKRFGKQNYDICEKLLVFLNQKVQEMSKKYDIIGNIEQIPGKSFAIRFAQADRIMFGEEKVPYVMYSNQFIPLWEDSSIWEKMDLDGKYNRLITGGGIVHAQIGEKINGIQARKIIEYSVGCGCEHFALNSIYTECVENHVSFGKYDKCPVCGGEIKDMYTRIVGFFTPVSSWQGVRRDWEFPRRTFADLNERDKNENKV